MAAAALDELAGNFTFGAPGAGNGSLSGAWYRRNQVRAARRAGSAGRAHLLRRPPASAPPAAHGGPADLLLALADFTAPRPGERAEWGAPGLLSWASAGSGSPGLRL